VNPDIDPRINLLDNNKMNPKEQKIVAALAVFLSAALPFSAGAIAFRSQPVLVAIIKGEAGKLPALTNFFFNNFTAALVMLFCLGIAATVFAVRAYREKESEPHFQMTKLLAAVAFSALSSVAFLTLFIFSVALPVYSSLSDR